MGINKDVGKRIQLARKAQGLTQKQLAEKLGLSTGTIQQYELGKRQPRFENVVKIAEALNTSVVALLDEPFGYVLNGKVLSISELAHDVNEYNEFRVHVKPLPEVKDEDIYTILCDLGFGLREHAKLATQIIRACVPLTVKALEKVLERIEELAENPKYVIRIPELIYMNNDDENMEE